MTDHAVDASVKLVDGLVSVEEALQLISLHNALAPLGYRPNVTSLTLHDIVHTGSALLLPVVAIRNRVWRAVEDCMGMQLELWPEFTALISWSAGAHLGYHTDNNREYLTQRHVSAVCYLNTSAQDFQGGDLVFRNPHLVVVPTLGRLVCFSSEIEHAVEAVLAGTRHTLTMWFTRNSEACEDMKVLDSLRTLPTPPPGLPDAMYLGQSSEDVRLTRLNAVLGSSCTLPAQQSQAVQPHEQGSDASGEPPAEDIAAAAYGWGTPAGCVLDAGQEADWALKPSRLQHKCLRAHFLVMLKQLDADKASLLVRQCIDDDDVAPDRSLCACEYHVMQARLLRRFCTAKDTWLRLGVMEDVYDE